MARNISTLLSICALAFIVACGGNTPKPSIRIQSPTNGATVTESSLTVEGTVNETTRFVRYSVNNGVSSSIPIPEREHNFSFTVSLNYGLNTISITAETNSGEKAETTIDVTYPEPSIELPIPDNTKFDITVLFNPVTDEQLTETQKSAFINAAERWSQIITQDIEDIGPVDIPANGITIGTPRITGIIDDLLIFVSFKELPEGVLGQAGPAVLRDNESIHANLPIGGIMEFNIAEFDEGGYFEDATRYEQVIVHEMGHVLGIGSLWSATNNVDENFIAEEPPSVPRGLPNPAYNPGFTGAGAVAEYSRLTGQPETVVPIANTGGGGNYNAHWREMVFGNELMTPYAGGGNLLSRVTAASLGDMGYTVNIDTPVLDSYTLIREIGIIEQVTPTTLTTFTMLEDFTIFAGSATGDVTAPVQTVDLTLESTISTSGCESEDFDTFISGNIALLRRGSCSFTTKIDNAKDAGAVAVLIFNQGDIEENKGLFDGGSNADNIPVLGLRYDTGVTFADTENLELHITVTRETGPFDLIDPISTASINAHSLGFKETILSPIGTMSSDGTITHF